MKYQEYLASERWAAVRRWALERADHHCQVCNAPDDLEVHHRTYARLGHEQPQDVVVLCDGCHELFHAHRRLAEIRERKSATHLPKTWQDVLRDRARSMPLFKEIQAAKEQLRTAETEDAKREALEEVFRLVRARNEKVRRGEAA